MANNLDNIIEKANNLFYKKNKDYLKKHVDINEIKDNIGVIKLDREDKNINNIVDSLFNGNVKVKSYDKSKVVLERKNTNNNMNSLVTLLSYDKNEDADKLSSMPNNNLVNRLILFSRDDKDNISVPINNFDISAQNLNNRIKNDKFNNFLKNKNLISVQISDNFDDTFDSENFLKNISSDDLKIFIFKNLYILYDNQRKFPKFRLNAKI